MLPRTTREPFDTRHCVVRAFVQTRIVIASILAIALLEDACTNRGETMYSRNTELDPGTTPLYFIAPFAGASNCAAEPKELK